MTIEPRKLAERPAFTDADQRVGRRCHTDNESPPGPHFNAPGEGLPCIRAIGHGVLEADLLGDGINHVGFRYNPELFYTEFWTW